MPASIPSFWCSFNGFMSFRSVSFHFVSCCNFIHVISRQGNSLIFVVSCHFFFCIQFISFISIHYFCFNHVISFMHFTLFHVMSFVSCHSICCIPFISRISFPFIPFHLISPHFGHLLDVISSQSVISFHPVSFRFTPISCRFVSFPFMSIRVFHLFHIFLSRFIPSVVPFVSCAYSVSFGSFITFIRTLILSVNLVCFHVVSLAPQGQFFCCTSQQPFIVSYGDGSKPCTPW